MGEPARSQPLAAPQLEHLGGEPGVLQMFLYGNLLIFVWLDQATEGSVARLREAGRYVAKTGMPIVGMVSWLTPDRPMPDPDTRRRVVEANREAFPNLAYSALILNGNGFWASAVRATLNGMRLLSPRRVDMRFDACIEDTAVWLPDVHRTRTGRRIPAETFTQIVRSAVDRSR